MFEKLKEKLKLFRAKAEKDLPEEIITEGFGKRVSESKLDEYLEDLKLNLIEADVAYEAAEEIIIKLKEKLAGKKLKRGTDVGTALELLIKDVITEVLSARTLDFDEFVKNSSKPVVIMFLGVNGTGKTTTLAKIAKRLSEAGYSVVIAASDTFRAGAIEQLVIHSEKLQIKVIKHQQGSDSAAVAFDAIAHAKSKSKGVVLIDTAGRMQTNKNLMDEMKKMKKVAKPDFTIFVGDALTGNDAINQAKLFDDNVGLDGIILCKIDADAKGGSAISIALTIKKPILFFGTGQKYEDLVKFDTYWFLNRIFSNSGS